MKTAAFLFAVISSVASFAGVSAGNAPAGPPFKVHGRLSVYCGNPAFRIWIVGTKKMLGVAESDPPVIGLMPAALNPLLETGNFVFGDFTVVPLTAEKEGTMRMVRVVAGENLVVTDDRLQFIRRVREKISE